MKNILIQILLNTLEPNTQVVKESQTKLKECYEDPALPFLLGEIISESQGHYKQLDLVATLALSKYIKSRYRSQELETQILISQMMMKLLEIVKNPKVINEVIMIIQYIVVIDYPKGIIFKTILENFTETNLDNLQKMAPFSKFAYLKLFYKCIKVIHRENIKTPEQLKEFRIALENYTNKSIVNEMRKLVNDLSLLSNQLPIFQNNPISNIELMLNETLSKISLCYFFESAKYNFKIYSFINLISKYSPLGDFNVIILAKQFHQIYKALSELFINSGLITKIKHSKELENITKLIKVTERHLMESIEHRILKVDDLEVIFEHFYAMYFSHHQCLIFYGEKFVDYNRLLDFNYLQMVSETEINTQMKFREEKLLIGCLNTFSSILINFGLSLTEFDLSELSSQDNNDAIKRMFQPKLPQILKSLMSQIFLIDIEKLYKFKTEPEEYYLSLNQVGDEDCDLREAAQAFLKNVYEYIDENIIIELGQSIQNDLLTYSYGTMPDFKHLLKRESNYYLLSKLYQQFRNEIDYDSLLLQCLSHDFKISDKNFDIVQLQLLQLVLFYVQKAYKFEENLAKGILQVIFNLLSSQSASNICLILVALSILNTFIQKSSKFISVLPEVALPVLNLFNRATCIESKLTVLEFFEHSIVGNFPEHYSIIWEICETLYQKCKQSSLIPLDAKSRIINVLVKLIENIEIEYQKVPFLFNILEESIKENESCEEIFLESSYHLFGKLFTKIDFKQLPNEIVEKLPQLVQVICAIMHKRKEYIPISLVILQNLIISEIPILLEIIGKNIIEIMTIWMNMLKETALKYYFDMIELYIMVAKDFRVEFSISLLEKILNSLKGNNQIDIIYSTNILRFLARLAFEDVEAFHYVLSNVSTKLGVPDCKYSLLSKFYEFAKSDFLKEETVYGSYYFKRNFCFFTFAILAFYLKELEENEGINFNKIALNQENIFQTDLKAILPVFCKCLFELYEYDSNQLDHAEPEIYLNLAVLFEEDKFLKENNFLVDSFKSLIKLLLNDPMRKFNIYSQVRSTFSKSLIIWNDAESKALVEKILVFEAEDQCKLYIVLYV